MGDVPRRSATILTTWKTAATAVLAGGICHASFAAAVIAMMVMMHFGMSHAFGRALGPTALACNALLLLQFPLVHSLLLSKKGGRILMLGSSGAMARTLVTTTYVAVASWQTLALFLLWSPTHIIWWRASGSEELLIDAAQVMAWLGLAKAVADAGLGLQLGYLGWWAVLRRREPRYPPMAEKGLFRWCRQPIYLAFSLTVWTVPTWTPDQLLLATWLTAYCVLGPLLKEGRLRRRFGGEFAEYQRRTPYWIPRLRSSHWSRTAKPRAKSSSPSSRDALQ